MKTIGGDYRSVPRRSCKPYDAPTSEKAIITVGGNDYVRTVHERRIWRNMGRDTLVARFVIVNGMRYVVD